MRVTPWVFHLLVATVLCAAPFPLQADTDYQCLHECVNKGSPSATCLTDCSYTINDAKPPLEQNHDEQKAAQQKSDKFYNSHNVFKAPEPVGNEVVLGQKKSHPDLPPLDWVCMKDCLQPSKSYMFCEIQCSPNTKNKKMSMEAGVEKK